MRNEFVVDVRVVRKSMQHHESRTTAWKVPDIEVSASVRNPVLGESWKGRALGGSARYNCGAFCGSDHDFVSAYSRNAERAPATATITVAQRHAIVRACGRLEFFGTNAENRANDPYGQKAIKFLAVNRTVDSLAVRRSYCGWFV